MKKLLITCCSYFVSKDNMGTDYTVNSLNHEHPFSLISFHSNVGGRGGWFCWWGEGGCLFFWRGCCGGRKQRDNCYG